MGVPLVPFDGSLRYAADMSMVFLIAIVDDLANKQMVRIIEVEFADEDFFTIASQFAAQEVCAFEVSVAVGKAPPLPLQE